MNRITKVLIVASMLLNTTLASAAFVVNNPNGGDGFVTGSFPTFTLAGADNSLDEDNQVVNLTTYTDTFLSDTSISFNWSYTTEDDDGSAFDKAGYLINNVFTQLSTDNLPQFGSINGTVMVSLLAGDVFGWYIDATDGVAGRGLLSVNANPSAVPVPAALPLLASAFCAFGIARRHKQKTA